MGSPPAGGGSHAAATLPRPLVVAIVPQLPSLRLQAKWAPLLDAIEERTGLRFRARLFVTIPEFERAVYAGEPDLVYLNPYDMLVANARHGYVPLVRDARRSLRGILVVREDSPLRDIEALDGKTLAFPAPNAFAASLYVRAILRGRGIHFTPLYVTTHSNVYRYVYLRKTDAGGGVRRTLALEPRALQARLRVLFETPPVAPHPFAAHPRVPRQTREHLVDAFLALSKTARGRRLLEAVDMPEPVRADLRRDYAPLRSLHLETFVEPP